MPRRASEVPNRLSRGFQKPPGGPKRHPGDPKEAPKRHQELPKRVSGAFFDYFGLLALWPGGFSPALLVFSSAAVGFSTAVLGFSSAACCLGLPAFSLSIVIEGFSSRFWASALWSSAWLR